MKIKLREWNIADYFRFLKLTLNRTYSGEFSRNFIGYLFYQGRKFFIKDRDYKFAILVNGKFAGSIAFYNKKDYYELGYFILREFRNKGVATKASKKILDFGFNKLKLEKVTTTTDIDNIPSQKILRKLGFKLKKKDKKKKEIIWEKKK